MFTREAMQRIEAEISQPGPNIMRLEGMSRAVLLTLQKLTESLVAPAQLWGAGVGATILATDENGVPAGSQYTRRWWLALQMALAVFTVAMKTPINVLANLAVTDGEQVILTPDNQLVRPFDVFDQAAVASEFAGMTLERLVYSDPETAAPA